MSKQKKRVTFYYHDDLETYIYYHDHPMKPFRIPMTNELIKGYNLTKKMKILRPSRSSVEQITRFHTDEYINFLSKATPNNIEDFHTQRLRFNVGEDTPIFEGVFDFCQISAGGSIGGAVLLNHNKTDIAINWAGGLHHAKRGECSGFCYVNDIVLGILELLKYHQRVLYIDIDIHHGDGVEEAFYTTDRVMTCSFHKYGNGFFPGTGQIDDLGHGKGKSYSINFPMDEGMDDKSYVEYFKKTIDAIMAFFQPNAVVIQCGADSLTGDRLGCFNLTLKGHGECVSHVRSFNTPLLVLGGGGYTIRNVSRCWAYETSLLIDGYKLPNELPTNKYQYYYSPDYQLNIQSSYMKNLNSKKSLHDKYIEIYENLRNLTLVPSVGERTRPIDFNFEKQDFDENYQKESDLRFTEKDLDQNVEKINEFYELDQYFNNKQFVNHTKIQDFNSLFNPNTDQFFFNNDNLNLSDEINQIQKKKRKNDK
ncbi:histone deacetylase [Anaeramoeba flamelloides]|uniref:Histone deacetylase n=1 Tax=Anaeramoeba flamelloides TaxID=1746091 RepID=A0AAV7YBS4_9EUKA|nr:histone deacetylase [Anaeramoeba flamelloides]